MKRLLMLLAVLGFSGSLQAGNIIMTGHDVLLHAGQRSFDAAALDYIRDGAAKASYDIAVIGTAGVGSGRFTGGVNVTGLGHGGSIALTGSTLSGYGSATFWDAASIAAADFSTVDAIVILSHTSCGGCSLTTAGADALEALAPAIATAFNAGLDIWANSGADDATYYDFLPPAVATAGHSIGGSSGFSCTASGLAVFGAVGCTGPSSGGVSMINGYPTHNRFSGFDASFDILEERVLSSSTEVITIGLLDAVIGTDDISTVPEPGTLTLFGLGLLGLGSMRRRRKAS